MPGFWFLARVQGAGFKVLEGLDSRCFCAVQIANQSSDCTDRAVGELREFVQFWLSDEPQLPGILKVFRRLQKGTSRDSEESREIFGLVPTEPFRNIRAGRLTPSQIQTHSERAPAQKPRSVSPEPETLNRNPEP